MTILTKESILGKKIRHASHEWGYYLCIDNDGEVFAIDNDGTNPQRLSAFQLDEVLQVIASGVWVAK